MNYFVYPLKNMRITQNYNSNVSHKLHWYNSKDYKDYPIDDGGANTSREGIYCPCDEMRVTAIKGVGNKSITNTIWLVSTTKVNTPTFNDYAFMVLTHSNDSDFKNIKVGTTFKRGQLIVKEGENVNVATHIHMSFGRGTSNGWIYNSNKKLVVKGNTKKPEEVCYLDSKFTNVKNKGGIAWVNKPVFVGSPVSRNKNSNQIKINVENLRARDNPNGKIVGYINKGIYNYTKKQNKSGYDWYNVEKYWIAYDKSWSVLYPKKEVKQQGSSANVKPESTIVIGDENKNLLEKLYEIISKLLKK